MSEDACPVPRDPAGAAACPHSRAVPDSLDVVVAGGSIAGSTTAVALGQRGFKVLLAEAGLPNAKRLAGELLHPPAVEALEGLGLAEPLRAAGAVPVYGFAVVRGPTDRGVLLSYSEIPGGRGTGLALEHATITRTLFDAASARPNVTAWEGARVLEANGLEGTGAFAEATVRHSRGDVRVATRIVVSAEGRSSKLRDQVGIETTEEPPFRMAGWKVPGGRLPYPGYGHVFTGGPTATLAYQVSLDAVRVMFEIPHGEDDVPEALLHALPEPFRSDVRNAMANEPRASARFVGFRPAKVASGRLAVVGDAGGCVHPLIASGMSFCIGDALRLADALGDPSQLLTQGLLQYERQRKGPMRTRSALGPAMVEALCSSDPSMQLLRHGLFRYWDRSSRGRGVSMGLLSTREDSMLVMAREYALVCAHALTGLAAPLGDAVPRGTGRAAVSGLVRRSAGFLRAALAA